MTEWGMRVRLDQLHHPKLVFLEIRIAVVHVLVDVALQPVDELLLVEPIELFGHEGFVVAKGCNYTMNQGKALEEAANLMNTLTHSPAFGHQLLNLLGIDHDGQTGATEEIADAFPRDGLTGLNHDRKDYNLHVGQTEFLTQEGQGILKGLPELVTESGVF